MNSLYSYNNDHAGRLPERQTKALRVLGVPAPLHIGMCPWCGQSLHPGRRCENDDVRRDATRGST